MEAYRWRRAEAQILIFDNIPPKKCNLNAWILSSTLFSGHSMETLSINLFFRHSLSRRTNLFTLFENHKIPSIFSSFSVPVDWAELRMKTKTTQNIDDEREISMRYFFSDNKLDHIERFSPLYADNWQLGDFNKRSNWLCARKHYTAHTHIVFVTPFRSWSAEVCRQWRLNFLMKKCLTLSKHAPLMMMMDLELVLLHHAACLVCLPPSARAFLAHDNLHLHRII